jgi:hypothetical protein
MLHREFGGLSHLDIFLCIGWCGKREYHIIGGGFFFIWFGIVFVCFALVLGLIQRSLPF